MSGLIVDILRERAVIQGSREAYRLAGEAGDVTLTYADLDAAARRVAVLLQTHGVGPGARVLLVLPPGGSFIQALFGVLYAGAVAVPTQAPRAGAPVEHARLGARARDARAAVALVAGDCGSALREELSGAGAVVVDVDNADGCTGMWGPPTLGRDMPALIQYTSGSTLTPRGVVLTHGNLLHHLEALRRGFRCGRDSRLVTWLPPTHDMGLVGGIFQPVFAGFPATVLSPTMFLHRPLGWLERISRERATHAGGPDFAYALLCRARASQPLPDTLDLSCWKVAFNGAEPLRAAILEQFVQRFGPHGFRREAFHVCYGLAEATLCVASRSGVRVESLQARSLEAGRAVAAREGNPARTLVSCGRPLLPQEQVRVVDPEALTPCPPGFVGEVWVAGPAVAAGYWQRPEETEHTFHAHTAGGEGPYLRTGDLGFLLDGELFIAGRRKDVIKVNGRAHHAHDIECTVASSHEAFGAGRGAAFGIDSEAGERLVVVQEVRPATLREHGAAVLERAARDAVMSEYGVTLHALVLVRRVPRTTSGKVQRAACREAWLARTLEPLKEERPSPEAPAPVVPAAEDLHRAREWLRQRIADKLGVEVARLDPRVPLGRYGLDSRIALELAGEVGEGWGREVSPTMLHEHPTVDGLAAWLTGREEEPG
ncbi:AMP-binding protein, partial [Corallococcus llansteffanensis]